MAESLPKIDLEELGRSIREARQAKGWTGEQLAYELRRCGFPTSQNRLWRLENDPPMRVDTELILWLEKVLGVELIGFGEKRQVLIEDVLELLDGFADRAEASPIPSAPDSSGLQRIHDKIVSVMLDGSG